MSDLKKSMNKLAIRDINDGTSFLKDRVIFMEEDFDEYSCNEIKKQLLYLYSTKDKTKKITMYINSNGGSAEDFLMLYDLIKSAPCKIHTIGLGYACSAGALLLMVGDKRSAYKSAEIMVHGLSLGIGYKKLHSTEQYVKSARVTQGKIDDILIKHTNITHATLEKYTKEDNFLTAEQALKLGIIDKVIG